MARTTKTAKKPKAQPPLPEKEPQPTLTDDQAASEQTSPKERDGNGRFAAGNRGGPGNPHARHCARMLEIFRNTVSAEAFARIVCKLIEKAEAGDTSAAKIIVTYVVGKPLPAPHPDSIDRDEWDHYQKDAMNDKEMKLVMSALPTHVGNDIARTALPIMTDARTRDLARQLLKGCPVPRGEESGTRDEETEGSGPIPYGESTDAPVQPSPLHASPATPEFDPWDIDSAIAASTSQHVANEEDETAGEVQAEEQAPIANGKMKRTKHPRRHASRRIDAERPDVRSHVERGNENDPLFVNPTRIC
jgi:hypothetical protein